MEITAKNDWGSLSKKKIVGAVERDKIENIKNKIDKTSNQNVADLLQKTDDDRIDVQFREEPLDKPSALDVLTNKFDNKFTQEQDDHKKPQLFSEDDKQIKIRPEFNEMRFKVRDDLSNIMHQSEKLLIPKQDDEFYDAFATKNNMIKNIRNQNFQRQIAEHFNLEENKVNPENVKAQEEVYYDFKKLNDERLTRLIKDRLNRVFPNEMESIHKIKEVNYILQKNKSSVDPDGDDEEDVKNIFHPLFDKGDLYNEDYIESYSIMRDPAVNKLLEDVPIYRELAPIAREIAYTRNENNSKVQKSCIELMNDSEFFIDEFNINFDNIMHVASGRICSKRLNKILLHLDPLELTDVSDEDNSQKEEEEQQAAREEYQGYASSSPMQTNDLYQQRNPYKYAEEQMMFMNPAASLKYNQMGQSSAHRYPEYLEEKSSAPPGYQEQARDQGLPNQGQNQEDANPQQQQAPPKPQTTEKEIQTETFENAIASVLNKLDLRSFKKSPQTISHLPSEASDQISNREDTHRTQNVGVDQILEDIRVLKDSRKEALQLPNANSVMQVLEEIQNKMEKKLRQLLFMIMEEQPIGSDINENLKMVIKDVNKLKGKMLEGHLKTKLLFQFLKEYKTLLNDRGRSAVKGMHMQMEEEDLNYDYRENRGMRDLPPEALESGRFSRDKRERTSKSPIAQRPQLQKSKKQAESPIPTNLPGISENGIRHTQASLRKMKANLRDRLMEKAQKEAKSRWIGNPVYDDEFDDDEGWVAI